MAKPKKNSPLSRIAREAGIGACSFDNTAWHQSLQRILEICKAEGYDMIGEPIEVKRGPKPDNNVSQEGR